MNLEQHGIKSNLGKTFNFTKISKKKKNGKAKDMKSRKVRPCFRERKKSKKKKEDQTCSAPSYIYMIPCRSTELNKPFETRCLI